MKVLTFNDLGTKGIPFTRIHIGRLIKSGDFPQPVRIGSGRNGRIAWLEKEIDAWLAARVKARDAQPSERELVSA
jgi:prophage regulatory protein